MSIGFVAIFGHSLDSATIFSLPNHWNSDPNIGKTTDQFYQFLAATGWYPGLTADRSWQWTLHLHEWKGTDPEDIWSYELSLHGPCILSLHWGKRALYLSAPLRFSGFVSDPEAQIKLRRVCAALVRSLGGNEAIYLPDSGPWMVQQALDQIWESYSLVQIKEWLLQNIGAPSKTIQDVDVILRGEGNLGGYYIDRFEDIQSNLE